MKLCITSQGNSLDSQIDPRFGRCQYFIIVDPETMAFEAIENPNRGAMGGAGIQSAQLISSKGVEIVLTGNVGPNAFQTMQAAGIKIITGITGIVKEAIEQYKKGEIQIVEGPTVPGHFGMGQGMGQGMPASPSGGGRGWQGQPQQVSKEQELDRLKEQTKLLKEQMEQINKKIDEMTKKKHG